MNPCPRYKYAQVAYTVEAFSGHKIYRKRHYFSGSVSVGESLVL